MAGSARYTAILDACVLYPAPVRDLLLSLARDGLYHARWSLRIQEEWVRSPLRQRPDLSQVIERVLDRDVPDSYERALFKQKCDNVFELSRGPCEPREAMGRVEVRKNTTWRVNAR